MLLAMTTCPRAVDFSAGMVWVDGGTFRMGSDRHYPEEAPAHQVRVDGFWIDRTPVTNRQFASSSRRPATSPSPRCRPMPRTIRARCRTCCALAIVFTPPQRAVDLSDWSQWWSFKFGADWRRPY